MKCSSGNYAVIEQNIKIVKNDASGYYHIQSWVGEEKLFVSELHKKFSKLGFTGYEIMQRNSDYVVHFSNPGTEAQFLLYFNDVIMDNVKSIADMNEFKIMEYF